MNYEEAIEATVTRAQARREIEAHGADFTEFVADCGDREEYPGTTVLGWLGY